MRIEPYGVDISARIAELARQRLPRWANRIHVGNAIDWVPADGRRFTFVHTLLDCVPAARRDDLIRHVLERLVEPGGRALISFYLLGAELTARQYVERLGLPVRGESGGTVWIDAPG